MLLAAEHYAGVFSLKNSFRLEEFESLQARNEQNLVSKNNKVGPSSGQHPCLLLQQSEFKSR